MSAINIVPTKSKTFLVGRNLYSVVTKKTINKPEKWKLIY